MRELTDPLDFLLRVLFETFGSTPTPAQIEGYRMGLEDIPLPLFEEAVRAAMKDCRFMPKPAELRDLAADAAKERARRAADARALPALDEEEEKRRIRETWKEAEREELERDIARLAPGVAREVAEAAARAAKDIR